MATIEQLLEIISDPYNGPEEGVDFWVDEDGSIQVPVENVFLAGTIMRKANTSGKFNVRLVKVGQRGDTIQLGFDTLADASPIYTAKIGYKRDTVAEVKQDEAGKFAVYLNKQRTAKLFKKLTAAKQFLKKLDKELQEVPVEPESFEE